MLNKRQLNKGQIAILHIAVKAAGILETKDDRRYRMLLGQYQRPDGSAVTTCKDLTNGQLGDMLAICEARGWRCPGRAEDYFRKKSAHADSDRASWAQIEAILHLAKDLGWDEYQIPGMVKRVIGDEKHPTELYPAEAYKVIEALKAMVSRKAGRSYKNLREIQKDMEAEHAEVKV